MASPDMNEPSSTPTPCTIHTTPTSTISAPITVRIFNAVDIGAHARRLACASVKAVDAPEPGERTKVLLERDGMRIERIVSFVEAGDTVYDQDHDEWLYLVSGGATIDVAGDAVELAPGDDLFLPTHCPHKVTRIEHPTVWIAVHFAPE
jgi:cupin 2 domain-containing protein